MTFWGMREGNGRPRIPHLAQQYTSQYLGYPDCVARR